MRIASLVVVNLFFFSTWSLSITQRCFNCLNFAVSENNTHARCSQPGVCYSDYCYTILTTTLHPLFISGCVKTEEVLNEFGLSSINQPSVYSACQASYNVSFMFCICRNTIVDDPNGVCNFNEKSLALHAKYKLVPSSTLAEMLDAETQLNSMEIMERWRYLDRLPLDWNDNGVSGKWRGTVVIFIYPLLSLFVGTVMGSAGSGGGR